MATVKLYIDSQMVLPEIASNMLAMTGWEDSGEIKYCTTENGKEIKPYDLILNSDRFIAYAGNEFAVLAISKNRNITVAVNLKVLDEKLYEHFTGYDYLARTYYISSKLTELNIDSVGITTTKYDDDYLYLTWELDDHLVEAYISFEV